MTAYARTANHLCLKMSGEMSDEKEQLILRLHEIGGVKFGDFKLKSGIQSPAYFDLRVIVSYPELMGTVASYLWKAAENVSNKYASVCGVPYTALPLATVISVEHNIPMLIRRREAKDYGTKKMIEGHYKEGDICLVVEDVTTSGSSVLETVQTLADVGVMVKDAVVLLEREQGGQQKLQEKGITLHSVFTMSQLVHTLHKHGRIDAEMLNKVLVFIQENRFDSNPGRNGGDIVLHTKEQKKGVFGSHSDTELRNRWYHYSTSHVDEQEMTFKERAEISESRLAQQLFYLMEEKRSNLAISVDLTTSHDVLQNTCTCIGDSVLKIVQVHGHLHVPFDITHHRTLFSILVTCQGGSGIKMLIDKVGPYVCIVKTHVDIISDFSEDFVQKLTELAAKHHLIIFEDRKFADIGNTVRHQYNGGIYKIADWAHIVNAHTVPGPGVVQGLKQVGLPKGRGCLLIAEMSSDGNLAKGDYTKATVQVAEENKDFVIGFICQNRLSENPQMLHLTPGVQLEVGNDSLGQRYITPRDAILTRKSDIIIVGRGITMATDPQQAARQYQEAAYNAYLERIS